MISSGTSLHQQLQASYVNHSRSKRDAPNDNAQPSVGHASTTSGDRGVLEQYVNALRNVAGGSTDGVSLDNIPADSTYGRWLQQLYVAAKSPRFEALAKLFNIDTSSPITVNHVDDTITAMVNGKPTSFSASQLGREWAEATAPLMAAARALTYEKIEVPSNPTSAPLQEVARFYGEVLLAYRKEETLARATQLEHNQEFDQMAQDKPFVNKEARAPELLDQQIVELGDNNVKFTLADKLAQYDSTRHYALPEFLREQTIALDPNSSYAKNTGRSEASFEDVLATYGWRIPKDKAELIQLINALLEPALPRPKDGNFAGALTWPTPLSTEARAQIFRTLSDNDPRLPGLDPEAPLGTVDVLGALVKRVPDYILNQNDPMAVIDWILSSEEGQQLGTELRIRAGDKADGASARTWLLTALGVTLDAKSLSQPQENHVAGFNLGEHEGKHPSEIKQALIEHLQRQGITTPQAAPIAAVLLLSRVAPALLVKGIPEYITKGSFEWLALKATVARIETLSPGASAHMSYTQIVDFDEITPASAEEAALQDETTLPAIIEWGKTHGTLGSSGPYSPQSIKHTRKTIDQQQQALNRSYEALKAQAPSQRSVALAELKAVFGEGIDFEEKSIRANVVRTDSHKYTPSLTKDPVGSYSLLDLYLSKKAGDDVGWFSSNPKITEQIIQRMSHLPDPIQKHEETFDAYGDQLSKAWSTLTQNLIANLPMVDRKNIEYGKLTVYQTGETTRSEVNTSVGPVSTNNRFAQTGTNRSLIIKTERDGQTTYYQFDPQNYSIRKRPDLNDTFKEGLQGPWEERPSDSYLAKNFAAPTVQKIEASDEQAPTESDAVPISFTSPRSEYLGNLLSTNILPLYQLGRQKDASREVTTFDREAGLKKTLHEIFLGVVPGASAIRHIINGDYLSATGDVINDIVLSATFKGLSGVKALNAGKGARLQGVRAFGQSLLQSAGQIGGKAARGAVGRFFHRLKPGSAPKSTAAQTSPTRHMTPQQVQVVAARRDLFEGSATSADGVTKRTIAKYDAPTKKWREYDPLTNSSTSVLHKFDPIVSTHLDTQWMRTIRKAENGPHGTAYRTGYLEGTPETVPGYVPGMTSAQIKKLTVTGNLSPRDIGILVRQQERLAVNHSLTGVNTFNKEVRDAGGRITPMPQLFYLSQTQPLSEGQCAALSHLMLEAMQHGKGQTLIDNFYAAAANPKAASSKKFINSLNEMQAKLTTPTAFHGGRSNAVPHSAIAEQLMSATESKTLLIGDAGHAMTAGVRIEGGAKKFFFYEPNYGLATFDSAESFQKGLNNIFTSKEFSRPYKTVGQDPSNLELSVSDYNPSALDNVGISPRTLQDTYFAPI